MPQTTTPVRPGYTGYLDLARTRWRERLKVGQQHGLPLKLFTDAYKTDLLSIERGGTPMSDYDAFVAVQSLAGNLTAEEGQDGGFGPFSLLENAAEDLKMLVYALPQLPGFLVDEVKLLSDPGPEGLNAKMAEINKSLADGDTRKAIETFAMAPGVRLTPGSYVAHELAGGRPEELAEHPVFTLLDVLPFASAYGLTTKAGTALKNLPPVEKLRQNLANRGLGKESVMTARWISQTNRRVRGEGPDALRITEEIGTYSEFVEGLAKEVIPNITKQETARLWDLSETATDAEKAALPARHRQVLEWWDTVKESMQSRGVDFDEMIRVPMPDGSVRIFPPDPDIMQYLKDMVESDRKTMDPKAAGKWEEQHIRRKDNLQAAWTAKTELRELLGEYEKWQSNRVAYAKEVEGMIGAEVVDPGARITSRIEAAESRLTETLRVLKEEKPKKGYKDFDRPYPSDLPPLRPGEQLWNDGKRLDSTTGEIPTKEVIERRGAGQRRPTEGSGRWWDEVSIDLGGEAKDAALLHGNTLNKKILEAEATLKRAEEAAGATAKEIDDALEGYIDKRAIDGTEGMTPNEFAEQVIRGEIDELSDLAKNEYEFGPLAAGPELLVPLKDIPESLIKETLERIEAKGYEPPNKREFANRIPEEHRAFTTKKEGRAPQGAPLAAAQKLVKEGVARFVKETDTARGTKGPYTQIDEYGAWRDALAKPKGKVDVGVVEKRYKLEPVQGGYISKWRRGTGITEVNTAILQVEESLTKIKSKLESNLKDLRAGKTLDPLTKADEPVSALLGEVSTKATNTAHGVLRKADEARRKRAGLKPKKDFRSPGELMAKLQASEPELVALVQKILEDVRGAKSLEELNAVVVTLRDEIRGAESPVSQVSSAFLDLDTMLDDVLTDVKGGVKPAEEFSRAEQTLVASAAKESEVYIQRLKELREQAVEQPGVIAGRAADDPLVDAVRVAEKEREALAQHKEHAQNQLRKVKAGEADPAVRLEYKVKKVTDKHIDSRTLEALYAQLDDIAVKGAGSVYFKNLRLIEAEVAKLETRGVPAQPGAAKSAASKPIKKQVTEDPSPAYLRAQRMEGTRGSIVKKLKAVGDSLPKFLEEFAAAKEFLRKAEESLRVDGNPVVAKRQLASARLRITPTGAKSGRGKFARDVLDSRRVGKDIVDAVDTLRRQIDELDAKLPSGSTIRTMTNRLGELEKAWDTGRRNAAKARKKGQDIVEGDLKKLTDAQKREAKWLKSTKSVPAEWQPNLLRVRKALMREAIDGLSDVPTRARAEKAIRFNMLSEAFEEAGMTKYAYNVVTKQATEVIHAMIESGRYSPEYLPHRQIDRLRRRSQLKMADTKAITPQQFKRRGINAEPYTRDFALAIHDWMLDHLRRTGMEEVFFGRPSKYSHGEEGRVLSEGHPGIYEMFGSSHMDLISRYEVQIEKLIKQGWEPDAAAHSIITKDWTKVDPTTWGVTQKFASGKTVNYTPKGLGIAEKAENVAVKDVWVPKGVAKTLQDFSNSGGMFPFTGLYDKAMDVFRISALALSPRFLVYNAIGGLVMTMARTDPMLLVHLRESAEMVKGNKMPTGISRGTAYAPPELTRQFSPRLVLKDTDANFLWGMAEGSFLGDIFQKVQSAAGKSFRVNEWFDNVYRSAAYLHEVDRMKGKGASAKAARESGIDLANKVLQDWDAMLPWERTVMRRVFPFYGWMKHILKYTFTMPFDHPVRVAVISNFAEAEMRDRQEGLPQWLDSMLYVGKEGKDMKQWSFALTGVNPFTDVVEYSQFDSREWGSGTILGFMSQTSPLLGVVQETLGVNPITSRAQLYPEIMYDNERGRIRPVAPSILETLPKALVPQVLGVWGIMESLGIGTPARQLRELRSRDPDAFRSRIYGSFGIPFSPRRRSRKQEAVRAGLARERAASDTVNRALRSGDWSRALRYERVRIRGHMWDVKELYRMAQQDPEYLEMILSA